MPKPMRAYTLSSDDPERPWLGMVGLAPGATVAKGVREAACGAVGVHPPVNPAAAAMASSAADARARQRELPAPTRLWPTAGTLAKTRSLPRARPPHLGRVF